MANWRTPGQSMGYDYSQGPRPGSIDWDLMQRAKADEDRRRADLELEQQQSMAQMNQQLGIEMMQAKEAQGLDTMLQKRRLGLGTLQEQLADKSSDMYGYDGPSAAVSVGNELGPLNAPAPIETPRATLGLSPLGRAAVDATRSQNRTRSVDEAQQILDAEADARLRVEQAKLEGRQQLAAQNNQSKGVLKAADIQAGSGVVDSTTLANDAQASMTLANRPRTGLSPMQAPAFSDEVPAQAEVSPEAQALLDAAKKRYPEKSDAEIMAALQAKGLI